MFKLIKLSGARLAVLEDGVYAVGTFKEAVEYLIDTVGIKRDEIMLALDCMDEQNHNCADFGVCGMFTFSERIDTSHIERKTLKTVA